VRRIERARNQGHERESGQRTVRAGDAAPRKDDRAGGGETADDRGEEARRASVAASTVKECQALRGNAKPNAHAAAGTRATIGNASFCAKRSESTSSNAIDITANAPGMDSLSRSTSARARRTRSAPQARSAIRRS